MKQLLIKLNNYWFKPLNIRYLNVARFLVIVISLVIYIYEAITPRDITLTGGNTNFEFQKWLTTIEPSEYSPQRLLRLVLLPFGWDARPDIAWIDVIWWAGLIFGLLALIGLLPRLSLLVFAFVNSFFVAHAYSYKEYHHPEAILVIALVIFALGYNKETWSLIKFRKKSGQVNHSKSDEFNRWPFLLIQWMFVLIYFSAGLEKLVKSGFEWFNGYTLAYQFARDGFLHGLSLGVWAAGFPDLLIAGSIFAVLLETTFVIAVLFPRTAWFYVLSAALFHGSSFLVQATPFIFYYVPLLFIVFIEPLHETYKKISESDVYKKRWKPSLSGFRRK